MPWIAPEVADVDEPAVADELTMLTGWLESHRARLLHKCRGLTGEQLARWSVPPSNLSLLGLIRHLTDVERVWFRQRFRGEDVPPVYPGKDTCFTEADPAHAERDYARLTAEWEASRRAVAGADLTETFEHDRYGTMSLRWLYGHLIREYAGHIGHADLLRERIDGVTG